MKRVISLTLAVLLIAALFVGCSSSPAGDVDTLLEYLGVDLDHPENLMQFVLKEDGTADYKLNLGDVKEGSGTWKLEGDKLTLTLDGDAQEIQYKDGQMILELGSSTEPMTIVLGK